MPSTPSRPYPNHDMLRQRRPRHTRFGGSKMEHMRVRQELLDLILRVAAEDGLDQWAFSHMFGITQPRANNLAHRHIEKFNTETLIDMLARVGVRLDVRAASRDRYRRWDFGEHDSRAGRGQPSDDGISAVSATPTNLAQALASTPEPDPFKR